MKLNKHTILLGAAIFVLALFFMLPRNKAWVTKTILPYWQDFRAQKQNLDIEYRKIARYRSAYTFSTQIADHFGPEQRTHALVLLPPSAYFKKNGIRYQVPEPVVFYYYTGLKTVWVNSHEAAKANWYVRAEKGRLFIDSVTDARSFADTIRAFKTYPVSL